MQSTKNTGKYRTATKIQEFTGFTGPLGSLEVPPHFLFLQARSHFHAIYYFTHNCCIVSLSLSMRYPYLYNKRNPGLQSLRQSALKTGKREKQSQT